TTNCAASSRNSGVKVGLVRLLICHLYCLRSDHITSNQVAKLTMPLHGEGHKGIKTGVEGGWPVEIPPYRPSLISFTVPNARCPICKEQVFYYWNEFGSSVFFDQLGHPWPKHSCTGSSGGRPVPILSGTELREVSNPYHHEAVPVYVRLIKSQQRFLYRLVCTDMLTEKDINLYIVCKSRPDISVEMMAEYYSGRARPILKYLSHSCSVRSIKVFASQFSAAGYIESNIEKFSVKLGGRALAERKKEEKRRKSQRKIYKKKNRSNPK
ncbi:MAG: hypothetical protein K6L73_06350, partial [Cellvibrionaceae bacterium]